MTDADFLTVQEPPLDPAIVKACEASFTPFAVAAQALHRAADFFGGLLPTRYGGSQVGQFLDPSAGAGVWCQAARSVLDPGFIYAVELRESERQWLVKNADDCTIGDFLELELSTDAFDLLATNPPFSRFSEFAKEGLRVADRCWLYAPSDIYMRTEKAAAWFEENQQHIAAEFTTPGPVAFNGGSNADWRTYSLWCLDQHGSGRGWHREVLPWLPGDLRRWRDRPGTVEVPGPWRWT